MAWVPEIQYGYAYGEKTFSSAWTPEDPSPEAYETVAMWGNEKYPTDAFRKKWEQKILEGNFPVYVYSEKPESSFLTVTENDPEDLVFLNRLFFAVAVLVILWMSYILWKRYTQ